MRLAPVLCDEGKENSLRQGAPAKTGSKTSQLLQISSAQCKQSKSLFFWHKRTPLLQVPHTDQTFTSKRKEASQGIYIKIKITDLSVKENNKRTTESHVQTSSPQAVLPLKENCKETA